MRIGLCATASDGGKSGISVYMRAMVRHLPEAGSRHDFDLIADERDVEYLGPGKGVGVIALPARLCAPLRNILWHQLELPCLAVRRRYDLLFVMAANRRVPAIAPCPTVGVVHDLASFHVLEKYDPWRSLYVRSVLPSLISRLTHVIAISDSGRRDVLAQCGIPAKQISVIPLAVDTARYAPGDAARAHQRLHGLSIHPPYFLYVSRIEHPGKNHVGLVDAFDAFKARGALHQLVLAGADRERADEVHARVRASPFRRDIHVLGFTSDEVLLDLYHGAQALIFPSLYEGFGLPVLEGMACGLPVACSNVSSLPEVAGDAALYFDPRTTASVAGVLETIADSAHLRAELEQKSLRRAAEFSMAATARRTLDVLERVAWRQPVERLVTLEPADTPR